jgi:hypothetical protein
MLLHAVAASIAAPGGILAAQSGPSKWPGCDHRRLLTNLRLADRSVAFVTTDSQFEQMDDRRP